jgi:hypothetical protein
MPRLTDEQVKVLADWEEGGPAWYRAECFKTDIQEERNEFDLLRDLALDHAELTAALAACEADYAEAVRALEGCVSDLIWCSGSDDFSVDGVARIGWLKGPEQSIKRAGAVFSTPRAVAALKGKP